MIYRILTAAAAVTMCAGSLAAAPVFTFGTADVGVSRTISFSGFTDSFAGGTTALSGLTASATYGLQSIAGNQWTFTYSIANTSGAPVTSSRVSVFGFNVGPTLGSASATGEFDKIGSGTVPIGRGSRDACFSAGPNGSCSNGGGNGVTIGEAASTGTFRLIFSSPTTSVTLSKLFVRYQSLNGPNGISGASGVGDALSSTVPEPTTWAMLILGFGTVGSVLRRRRLAAI